MSGPRLAILTRRSDFHASAVQWALGERGVRCAVVETDAIAGRGGLTWSPDDGRALLRDVEGEAVDVAALDLVWWRRLTGAPVLPDDLTDPAARDLVTRDCRASLVGVMHAAFRGAWVSHPTATHLAENKLVQLQAARRAGLRMPRTLVSQDPAAIRRFCAELDHRVVVKPVAGTPLTPVMAGRVTPELLRDDELALSPAIYQELVPGTRHLRICCFGDEIRTGLLESTRLDWRYPMDAGAEPYDLDDETAGAVRRLVADLGLRMGIGDAKLDERGRPVWLELNPQGQFLFLEGMCEIQLTRPFADFLVREARGALSGAPWP